MAQARGRSRRTKAGLISPAKGKPSAKKNDEDIDALNAAIIKYLSDELETYRQQAGMYKEVVAIGRALKQLRSPAPDHSEDADDGPPPGPDPHDRDRFRLPPSLRR